MNANGAAIISNPHPCGHIVYPYTDDNLVEQAVSLFTSAGLRDGEGVILVMTQAHREPFRLRLTMEGFNVEAYERSEQLICRTTEELLASFLVNGAVDKTLFKSAIGDLIERAKASATDGQPRKVRVFGEMVSQLRNEDLAATTRLEELWNDVIQEHSVALLCTYCLHNEADRISESLIDLHNYNIERERPASR